MKIAQINSQKTKVTIDKPSAVASIKRTVFESHSSGQKELQKNNENACNHNATVTTESTRKMNDDQNSNSNSGNINNNEKLNGDTTKTVIKNGALNGIANTIPAATLVTTAGTFQLPAPPHQASANTVSTAATRGLIYHPPLAQVNLVLSLSRASGNNNGLSPSSTSTNNKKSKAMAAATSAATGIRIGTSISSPLNTNAMSNNSLKSELSVIDYSSTSSSSSSILSSGPVQNVSKLPNLSSDIGRGAITTISGGHQSGGNGCGGRLQFFKDGKFILELARAKDGEKSGWVSVPRKLFRSPSATSYTVTPTSAISTLYPKNECSTSLSFSDDNSSIQSSPWQRDHCWKQSTPRSGISKEMALHYIRPKGVVLTRKALVIANRKKRKPYELTLLEKHIFESIRNKNFKDSDKNCISEESNSMTIDHKKCEHQEVARNENLFEPLGNNSLITEKIIKKEQITIKENLELKNVNKKCESSEISCTDIDIGRNGNINACEDVNCISSCLSTATLISPKCTDGMRNSNSPSSSTQTISPMSVIAAPQLKIEQTHEKQKMNISDRETTVSTCKSDLKSTEYETNGEVQEKYDRSRTEVDINVKIEKLEGEEKRLNKSKQKIRAKLNTIIQKLIDKVPARLVQMSRTQVPMSGVGSSSSSISNHLQAQKVSPPSSSAATRLVEYHQQHVSPRKRILREFEKVSLEDSSGVAGGKRSRAKGNTLSTTGVITTQFRSDKSPTNRTQTNIRDCGSVANSLKASATVAVSNGNHLTPAASNKPTKPVTTPTSSAQPRLYSSYSIHSLLSSNSSTSTTSSSNTKVLNDQAVNNNVSYQHQKMQNHKTDPSHLRSMLASPKSPESNISCGGGKSPSNATSKKRSPPYASPIQDTHTRSPMTHIGNDYGRRSPYSTSSESGLGLSSSHKSRYIMEHSTPSTSHISPQQGFYSSYMMSPKCVVAPQSSISPNSNITGVCSPRHSSAFNSNSQSSISTTTSFSTHIPHSSSLTGMIPRELSPPRSLTASPRDSTPRTLPKKTASIRRQFASPTASTTSSCPSPCDRINEEAAVQQQQDCKMPMGSNHSMLHRGSPSSSIANISAPFNYYMYPPPANGINSTHSSSTAPPTPINNTAAAVAAAAVAAYIPAVVSPPYYNPYISTLAALRHNPLWMHQYPLVGPVLTPPAAARLSPPFHNFPYNGATAIAVAAAAAAFGGMQTPMSPATASHFQHNSTVAAAQHHNHNLLVSPGASLHSGFNMGATTTHSTKLTDNSTEPNSVINNTSLAQNTDGTAATYYPNSVKDELSSDVPLNLSKH